MHLIGRKIDSAAWCSSLREASAAVRPMSPNNMFACRTCWSGTLNAFAIASSTRPSRNPMRRSPVKILTTY